MPTRVQTHIDRALTNISVAYIQDASNFIAARVFPQVSVMKQSDRYFLYKKEDWFRDEARERAYAAESAGGDYNIDNTPSYFCKIYAFHKDVTEDDRVNTDTPLNADQDAAEFVTQKFMLKKETVWANTFFKTGVWANEQVGQNADADVTKNKWNLTSSDPIKAVRQAQTDIMSTTGYRPNKLVLGPHTYDALCDHEAILDRIRFTQRGVITRELLASMFEVDEVLVAQGVLNSAMEGATESTDFIFGKHALLVYAAPRPALKTPTGGYTFTWTGLLGAGAFGNRIVRIPMDWLGLGTERVEGEIAFDMKVVSNDLGFFFNGIVD